MAESPLPKSRLQWIGLGALAMLYLLWDMGAPWGMWAYCGFGVLVAGFWFWNDRSPDKGARWDIAIALPFMAIMWPILLLCLPLMKHFRDGT